MRAIDLVRCTKHVCVYVFAFCVLSRQSVNRDIWCTVHANWTPQTSLWWSKRKKLYARFVILFSSSSLHTYTYVYCVNTEQCTQISYGAIKMTSFERKRQCLVLARFQSYTTLTNIFAHFLIERLLIIASKKQHWMSRENDKHWIRIEKSECAFRQKNHAIL